MRCVCTINPEAGVVLFLLGERRVKVMDETFRSAIFQNSASAGKGPCASFPLLAHFNLESILSSGSDRSNESRR